MKKISKYVVRNKSVITENCELEHLYTFKDFPVFFGCVDTPKSDDLFADMIWKIDQTSGIVQLTKLIPLDILYFEQHVDATGSTWKKYNNDFSDYVISNSDGNILEIGSGSGKIANLIIEKDCDINFTAVEPNPLFEEKKKLKIIKSFFNRDLKSKIDHKLTTVIFSQVLEHAYDPKLFLTEINEFLEVGGKLIFAYPNLEYWFQNKFTNSINFEHSMLLTDYFIDYLLSKTGFNVIEKKKYDNHSHFYTVEKSNNVVNIDLVNKYETYKNLFNDFLHFHFNMVKKLNDYINQYEHEVFLFGGHIFSQFLIQFGLNPNKIVSILDNSQLKQNKRLYGTDLIVRSPQILSDYKSPLVILKAGVYNEEVKADILNNINPNCKFL